MNATYSDTMTQYVEMTGSRMTADITTNTRDKVAGRIFSPKPLKTMDGDDYTIDLKFSTEVTRPPAGTKLPADGGEPGKALKALQAAIAKKSWDGIKSNVSAKNVESFDESYRTPKENLDDAIQTLGFWLPRSPARSPAASCAATARSSISKESSSKIRTRCSSCAWSKKRIDGSSTALRRRA